MFIALVNWNKCTGCGECISVCPVSCYEMEGAKSSAYRSTYCIDCGNCQAACPAGAITISIGWGGYASRQRTMV